jgi:hypothetical protein
MRQLDAVASLSLSSPSFLGPKRPARWAVRFSPEGEGQRCISAPLGASLFTDRGALPSVDLEEGMVR